MQATIAICMSLPNLSKYVFIYLCYSSEDFSSNEQTQQNCWVVISKRAPIWCFTQPWMKRPTVFGTNFPEIHSNPSSVEKPRQLKYFFAHKIQYFCSTEKRKNIAQYEIQYGAEKKSVQFVALFYESVVHVIMLDKLLQV